MLHPLTSLFSEKEMGTWTQSSGYENEAEAGVVTKAEGIDNDPNLFMVF